MNDLMEGDANMPDIQAHTIEAAKTAKSTIEKHQSVQNAGAGPSVKGNTDDVGRKFDPLLHETTPDGKPRLNKAGYIAKRRGGGPKGGPTASKINKTKLNDAASAPQNLEPVIQANAQMFTGVFLTFATLLGGEEFKPVVDAKTGENEPQFLQDTFANYFRIKGVVDIPPGLALTMGLGFYVAKRWNGPKFVERRSTWFGGVRRWWNDFRFRRQMAKETKTGDSVDNRTDDKVKEN